MIWINLIFFENLWFALYSLYLLTQTRNYMEISTQLNTLYNTTWATTIFIRYIYLYIIYILVNRYLPNYTIYSYIIHLPPLYNVYVEPVLRLIITQLYTTISLLGKIVFILVFCITIRIHPDTMSINPVNLYINISNIYNASIYDCVYHCCFILLMTIVRDYNYTNYKLLKYVYYYQYKYNFTITSETNTFNYFNKVIKLGYYKSVIDTPLFAYNLIRLIPFTFNYLIFVLYLYNILNCITIVIDMYNDSFILKWFINFVLLLFIDFNKEDWKVHLTRSICGLFYCNGIVWWLLINSETILFSQTLITKYTNIYQYHQYVQLELEVDENFW